MAKIEFKAKIRTMYECDGKTEAYKFIQVPELKRDHCDMNAFRQHPKYGSYANSDLFLAMLKRIRSDTFKGFLKLHEIPYGVIVDTSGFLAVVSFEV